MQAVSFTQMKDGTREDYQFLAKHEQSHMEGTVDRVLEVLASLDGSFSGYQVSRLGHSLISATMAHRDGADIDWVVTALLHDIGDQLAPCNHDELAAAVLRPYVREECAWVLRWHGTFQKIYYIHHLGGDPDEREEFRASPYFQACVDFCERWDQSAFDPNYNFEPIAFFEPMVREVFARRPWDRDVLRPGEVIGLP